MSRHLQAIIFDFDGVIADSEPLHLRAFQEALAEDGIPLTADDYYSRYLGYDDTGMIEALLRDRGLPGGERRVAFLVALKSAKLQKMLGSGAVLFSHVFGGGGSVASVELRDPTAPWRGETADKRLDERAYVELVRAIEASGFGAAPPVGLRLPSWAFYWVASACADGRFHFNAWRHPSERFSGVKFSRHLFDHDATGVPVNLPRPIDAAQAGMKPGRPDPTDTADFELTVGRDGLAGRLTPF